MQWDEHQATKLVLHVWHKVVKFPKANPNKSMHLHSFSLITIIKNTFNYLSLDRVERPCRRIGTTVWSRYALVGSDCNSTFGFVGFSAASFSFSTIFWESIIVPFSVSDNNCLLQLSLAYWLHYTVVSALSMVKERCVTEQSTLGTCQAGDWTLSVKWLQ